MSVILIAGSKGLIMQTLTRKLPGKNRLIRLGAAIAVALTAVVAAPAMTPTTAQAAAGDYCTTGVVYYGGRTAPTFTVPAAPGGYIACRMDQGAYSNAVSILQRGLNSSCAVSAGLVVDGDFGPATYYALKRAQAKFGVYADGIYGPNTARAFRWYNTWGGCSKAS